MRRRRIGSWIGGTLLGVSVALGGGGVGRAAAGDDVGRAAAVLDDWHRAAAEADAERYFGHFTSDGVFLGTDATERWTASAFREWARPYFERGRAWSFTPESRNVVVRGDVAWFDEVLDTPNLGPCRGTGVLVRSGAEAPWKIAHYNLTVPIPNAMVDDVVALIAGRIPAPSVQPFELELAVVRAAGVRVERLAADVVLVAGSTAPDLAVEDRAPSRFRALGAPPRTLLYDAERLELVERDAIRDAAGVAGFRTRFRDRRNGREVSIVEAHPGVREVARLTGATAGGMAGASPLVLLAPDGLDTGAASVAGLRVAGTDASIGVVEPARVLREGWPAAERTATVRVRCP